MIANTVIVLLLSALCCQIPSIKSSYVDLQFDKLNSSAIRISVDSGRLPFNQITVNYQLTVSDTKHSCKTNTTQIREFSDNYTARCEKDLYLFNYTASSSNESYSLPERYCGFQSITSGNSNSIILADLIPSIIYEIEVTVRENSGNRTVYTSVHMICTDLDLPIWNAQTDFGSLQIISQENATRKVVLYWRKVPEILNSGEKLLYSVICKGSNDEELSRFRTEENFWDLDGQISATSSYECRLKTENSKGFSANSPMIFIPEERRVIKVPPGFNISLMEKPNDKIEVSWTKFDRIGNESHYTLYLCRHDFGLDCGVMSAMISVDGSVSSVAIPKSVLRDTRVGISYSAPDANYSSGMVFPTHTATPAREEKSELLFLFLFFVGSLALFFLLIALAFCKYVLFDEDDASTGADEEPHLNFRPISLSETERRVVERVFGLYRTEERGGKRDRSSVGRNQTRPKRTHYSFTPKTQKPIGSAGSTMRSRLADQPSTLDNAETTAEKATSSRSARSVRSSTTRRSTRGKRNQSQPART